MSKGENNPFKMKGVKESKHQMDAQNGLKVPENYERYFVPAIGKPLAQELIQQAKLRGDERVLDVACGTGIVARLASDRIGGTGSVTGLDINPGMVAVARSVTPLARSINWYEASAETIPLPDNEFDTVFCQMGLQFMEDKSASLQEMRRVLKQSGNLFLNVPGPAGDLFAIFEDVVGRMIGPEAAGFVNHVFSLKDTSEIHHLLKNAGFKEVIVEAENLTLTLPGPKEFFRQYVQSTPLLEQISRASEDARQALEREVINQWKDFEEGGIMLYEQRILTASAKK